MINPNNYRLLADSLDDILNLELPISPGFLEKLSQGQRNYLASLIYQWSLGKDVKGIMISILDSGKVKKKYSSETEAYLKIKGLIN
jgi:hypothetical protein